MGTMEPWSNVKRESRFYGRGANSSCQTDGTGLALKATDRLILSASTGCSGLSGLGGLISSGSCAHVDAEATALMGMLSIQLDPARARIEVLQTPDTRKEDTVHA